VAGTVLAWAVAQAPWRVWLADRERQWVWLGSLSLLLAVWSMKAGITPGLSVRFLLMTALTLLHGGTGRHRRRAGTRGHVVPGPGGVSLFGPNLLCMAIVPALFTAWFTSGCMRCCHPITSCIFS